MIFITGDTHGSIDGYKLFALNDNYKGKKLTRNDYLIVTGDFGYVWDKESYKDLDYLAELDYTILFIDGNHENFDMLAKYEVEMWNGGKVQKIRDNVIHLMRGQIFTINKKTFFTFGGAESTDKQYRRKGTSWWEQEVPTGKEFEDAKENLLLVDNKVDYIITHAINTRALTASESPLSVCRFRPSATTDILEYFEQFVKYDAWFFGHYHMNIEVSPQKVGLYDNILKLKVGASK